MYWGEDEDEPDYICSATLSIFDPPRRLKMIDFQYFSKTGSLPFDADFSNEFFIEATENGCDLTVIQDGFPADSVADEYFAGCEAGWKTTLAGIEKYTKMKLNEDLKDTPS